MRNEIIIQILLLMFDKHPVQTTLFYLAFALIIFAVAVMFNPIKKPVD